MGYDIDNLEDMFDASSQSYLVSKSDMLEIQQKLEERDELAAELERVKAERDSARWQSSKWHELYNKKRKKLSDLEIDSESLKSRLPVNADGDVVLWGDEVWYWDPVENKPMGGKCHSFECLVGEGEFEIGVFVEAIDVTQDLYNSELFSTAESCRAAHEVDDG